MIEVYRLIGALVRISLDKTDLEAFIPQTPKLIDHILNTIEARELSLIIDSLCEDKFGDDGQVVEVVLTKEIYQLFLASAIRLLKSHILNKQQDT